MKEDEKVTYALDWFPVEDKENKDHCPYTFNLYRKVNGIITNIKILYEPENGFVTNWEICHPLDEGPFKDIDTTARKLINFYISRIEHRHMIDKQLGKEMTEIEEKLEKNGIQKDFEDFCECK